jgi:MFS family permease
MSSRLRQFAAPVTVVAQQGLAQQQVVLLLCCIMHAIHDGYTSAMYLLLPLIATDLQLSYAQVGFLKTLISGGQSLFQLPGGFIAERVGERRMLALGLATLSGAFPLLSPAWSFPTVATLCLLIGVGASLQHPLSSSLVSRAYEVQGRRTAMGTYNFAGDVGKVAFPALLSGMILVLSWRGSVELLGAFGLVAALVVWMGGKSRERAAQHTADAGMQRQKPRGLVGWSRWACWMIRRERRSSPSCPFYWLRKVPAPSKWVYYSLWSLLAGPAASSSVVRWRSVLGPCVWWW